MPDMHGIEVLRFLRQHQQYRDLPIIVLTTRGDEASRETAIAAGGTTYFTKPFVPQVLLATARTLLDGSHASASGTPR
jgi:two-component system chemotaxis response regulator CheY